MAGPAEGQVPAIHALSCLQDRKDVDARHNAGHDGGALGDFVSDQPKPKEQQLMSKGHGMFVWYDVMTTDTKPAQSFYHDVIGWNAADSGMPDRSYTIFSMGPTMIGGLMPIPEDARKAGAGPAWMGYIGV
ncbi:MAG: hypothetical protein WCA55_17735, partial [Xanthobacteraceae bacterium]